MKWFVQIMGTLVIAALSITSITYTGATATWLGAELIPSMKLNAFDHFRWDALMFISALAAPLSGLLGLLGVVWFLETCREHTWRIKLTKKLGEHTWYVAFLEGHTTPVVVGKRPNIGDKLRANDGYHHAPVVSVVPIPKPTEKDCR